MHEIFLYVQALEVTKYFKISHVKNYDTYDTSNFVVSNSNLQKKKCKYIFFLKKLTYQFKIKV